VSTSLRSFREIEAILTSDGPPTTRVLYELWEQLGSGTTANSDSASTPESGFGWPFRDIHLVLSFMRFALAQKEYLLVSDVYREVGSHWQKQPNIEPVNLSEMSKAVAGAKSRIGQSTAAFRSLEPWSHNDRLDAGQQAQILLQMGNILNDESHAAADFSTRLQRGERANEHFLLACQLMPSLIEARVKYAATLLSVSAELPARQEEARKWANETLAYIARTASKEGKSFKSALHTAILLAVAGKLEEAMQAYASLKSYAEATTGDLADARYEAQFIASSMGLPKAFFKPAFPPLQVIVFSGHMPDLPGSSPRFPPDLSDIRGRLRAELAKLEARVAFLSAAAGADLLFTEAFLERQNAELHLVLPWIEAEFLRTSVQPFDSKDVGPSWSELFHAALKRASSIRELSQRTEPGDEMGWQYAMEITIGMALQAARVSRLDLKPMVLWDGKPGRGAGGTAAFVEFWDNSLGQTPVVVRLSKENNQQELIIRKRQERCEKPTMHREVKSVLFGDIVGYSKLTESVIPEFVNVFLGKLSQLIAASSCPPLCINMWGDEIYGVFDHAREAGLFALQFVKFLREEEAEWIRRGLYYEQSDSAKGEVAKFPLNIRIGLHTGPVLAVFNPVLRQLSYTGSHVTRAARIQPVVEPGEVYASEEFAAMLELDTTLRSIGGSAAVATTGGDPICKYVGTMRLAKAFPGRFRIYRVEAEWNLSIEALAAARHKSYCETESAKGAVDIDSVARTPWSELNEEYKEANRSVVADIPYKLGLLGYELTSGPGLRASELKFNPEQLELLAKREHDRWMAERERAGWTYSPVRDNSRKRHHCLVAWHALPEQEREKDRDVVREIPKLIQLAGLRLTSRS
jgi:class 3 adenylate cyclase